VSTFTAHSFVIARWLEEVPFFVCNSILEGRREGDRKEREGGRNCVEGASRFGHGVWK